MKIKMQDKIIDLGEIENLKTEESVFSKKPLYSFEIDLNVTENNLDIIKNTLDKGIVFEVDENQQEIRKYRISSSCNTHIVNGSNTMYTYSLKFKEQENLNLETLQIGNLKVNPYEYSEDYDEQAIIINCKIKLNKEELDEFINIYNSKDNPNYFNVVRHGVENRVLKMRFGRVIWSENDNMTKISLTLVESNYDENSKEETYFNDVANLNYRMACLYNFKEELLNLLIEKDVITKEEKINIDNNIKDNIDKGYWQINKTEDVDFYD